jgi:acyl-CoA reductase-like NAD-dependent aldehyde dehydrogenase
LFIYVSSLVSAIFLEGLTSIPIVLLSLRDDTKVNLTLLPAVGALAAGNPVVIKPSEQTPQTSGALARAVETHFEAGVMRVVCGGVPLATELLKLNWGKIFFTGSERVGKIVAKAAVDTLTPVVLELGGKTPVIVDETAPFDLQTVANRITWAKLLNTGQTCCAPDYLLVHESKVDKLMEYATQSMQVQYGDNPRTSELGRIVSSGHAKRLRDMIVEVEKDENTRMILGCSSDCDPSDRYICPTIVKDIPDTARLWKEEIFGPILPVKTFRTRKEAIEAVRSMPGTPLALYIFTRQEKVLKEYMAQIRAGAVLRNDVSTCGTTPLQCFGDGEVCP